MKKLIFSVCILFSSLSFSGTRLVWGPVDHLYVPKGFDNNDSVEVVVTGFFPTPCYSRNTVKVNVVKEEIKIKVTALLSEDHYKWCPNMVVPYTEVVSVGNLQAGTYKITVNDESKNSLKGSITVTEASSSIVNDNLYAAITGITRVGSTNEFILKGVEHTDCFTLGNVEFMDNNEDTISILPIMKRVKKICPFLGRIVTYSIKVDFANMKVDRPLLHVRTLDGKSVNSIVEMGDQR